MTERGETGRYPRVEAWTLGAAALSDERYQLLVDRLYNLADEFGLSPPEPTAGTPVVRILTEVAHTPLDSSVSADAPGPGSTPHSKAQAEKMVAPTVLTRESLMHFTGGRKPAAFVNGTWNALSRLTVDISVAKGEISSVRSLAQEYRASIKSLTLKFAPAVEGDFGERPIDFLSLYDTLSIILANGLPRSTFPNDLGSGRLFFLAEIMNERLQLEVPLPVSTGEAKGLPELPPRHSRVVDMQSPYLRHVRQLGVEETAEPQNVTIVGREDLQKFASDLGVSPSAIEHFLEMFDAVAEHFFDRPEGQRFPRSAQWLNEDVLFMKLRMPRGGDPYPVVGLQLDAFIDAIYELESHPKYGKISAPFGLQIRKLARRYLDTVAPYVPEVPSGSRV